MDFAVDRLNEGHWLHLYPEGKVNVNKENMRIKWGVGRLIAECKVPPIIVPIYHFGMDSLLPNRYVSIALKALTQQFVLHSRKLSQRCNVPINHSV
jgi:1-acyl-sn-glycerol-3-phosphate acyltransferase